MKTGIWAGFAASLLLGGTAAQATLAPAARAMLDAAIAGGNRAEIDTLAKYARQANPDDIAEIDRLVAPPAVVQQPQQQPGQANAAGDAQPARNGFLHGWTGSGQLGGFISSGRIDTSGLSAGLSLAHESARWRHQLRLLADYQRSGGVTSREQFLAAYEPNYKFNDRLFAFGLAQFESDRQAGFEERYTLSGGLGYRLVSNDKIKLDVKASPALRRSELVVGGSDTMVSGLAGLNYRWTLSPTLSSTQDASLYVDAANSIFTSQTALNVKLGGKLSGQMALQTRHETDPAPGSPKTDTLTRMSLVYGF